jgi:hypothetical protein
VFIVQQLPLEDQRRVFVYLAYFDDSNSKQKDRKFQVLTAVLIEDQKFNDTEVVMGISVADLIPEDKLSDFQEFKAYELFGGYGPFDGVDVDKRMHAIEWLLGIVRDFKMPVFYCAIDQQLLRSKSYASANPLDMAFRNCSHAIEEWVRKAAPRDLILLIADECGKDKATLKASFREMRSKIRPPNYEAGKCGHLHDDMYFGDSRDSIGIQLADLCGYFIAKHLEGDVSGEGFYQIIKDQIVYYKVEPE